MKVFAVLIEAVDYLEETVLVGIFTTLSKAKERQEKTWLGNSYINRYRIEEFELDDWSVDDTKENKTRVFDSIKRENERKGILPIQCDFFELRSIITKPPRFRYFCDVCEGLGKMPYGTWLKNEKKAQIDYILHRESHMSR